MVNAVDVAERFANGAATKADLKRARESLSRTQPARSKKWPVLYSAHIRSVPAWHATREQIATGAKNGAGCAAWASTRNRDLGFDSMSYPDREYAAQADLLRDIFGNPFRQVALDPDWRTATAVAIAKQMYDSRDFSPMPILADALQDAECDNEYILDHCRGPGPHVRGCWVVDLVLNES